MEWAFGKRMTPQERLRKHQRALEKTQRELDRERVKLENQAKKLENDIKKSAKAGQMSVVKIQAKDLVRTRRCVDDYIRMAGMLLMFGCRYVEKFYQMRTQLQAISLRIQVCWHPRKRKQTSDHWQTVRSNEQMMQSMKGATSTHLPCF